MNQDLFLRANLSVKESPQPPTHQTVVELLLRVGLQMPETPFQWCFVDKPRAGTCFIVMQDPNRSGWPNDGIRYASNETIQRQTVPLSSHAGTMVELESGFAMQGIYPPASPAVPHSLDTPELVMARYRVRWRISTPGFGHPGLWMVYWGRDDRVSQRAPPGWERQPIRSYPLPPVSEMHLFPLKTAQPGPGAMSTVAAAALASGPRRGGPPQQPQQQQQQQQDQPIPPPPRSAQSNQVPSVLGTPQQQPLSLSTPGPALPASLPASAQASNLRASQTPSASTPQPSSQIPPAVTVRVPPQILQQQAAQLRLLATPQSFPASFDDSYDALSERIFAGLRYERNHAMIAPIFDATTCNELLATWHTPVSIDTSQIAAQLAELQADVEKLQSLASIKPKDDSDLLAPLPRLMPIQEMRDGAMLIIDARRQQYEAEEDERRKMEEEARVKLEAEQAREREEAEKREREEERIRVEAEERAQAEREAEAAHQLQKQEQGTQEQARMEVPQHQTQQHGPEGLAQTYAQPENVVQHDYAIPQVDDDNTGNGAGNGEADGNGMLDDDFLFSNNFDYGNGNEEMMGDSLFDYEFLNQQMGEGGEAG